MVLYIKFFFNKIIIKINPKYRNELLRNLAGTWKGTDGANLIAIANKKPVNPNSIDDGDDDDNDCAVHDDNGDDDEDSIDLFLE